MKTLQPNEKRLAWILASLVIIAGSVFLLKYALNVKDLLLKQRSLLAAQIQQYQVLSLDLEDWNQRQQWILTQMPVLSDDATAKLMEEVSKRAKELKVDVSQQKLLEPVTKGEFHEASIQLTANASMENIVKWLSKVEQFDEFRYVKKLDLKKDEKGNMIANVVVAIKGKTSP